MNKEIQLEELDRVSGGTVKEFKELLTVYNASTGSGASAVSEIPYINSCYAPEFEDILLDKYGVYSFISVGMLGSDLFSDPNIYVDTATGKELTHAEVVRRIRGC